ncbi:hypothetical protein FRC02_002807 [Tulasnella sp. 418]|nr:hypothetical protein FRC02_002807 [Tulasnella sp. 418]
MAIPWCMAKIATWSLLVLNAFGAIVNKTVDDSDSAFLYIPMVVNHDIAWTNEACNTCWGVPDASKVYGGTWHLGTNPPKSLQTSAELGFTGIGVFIYSIGWDGTPDKPSFNTNVNIILDGVFSAEYTRHTVIQSSPTYEYGLLAYSATGLSNERHNVEMILEPNSVFLLDYALVMKEIPDSTATKKTTGIYPVSTGTRTQSISSMATDSVFSSQQTSW